jgi:hypothetical protein
VIGGLLQDWRLIQGDLLPSESASRCHTIGPSQPHFAIVTSPSNLGTLVACWESQVADDSALLASPAAPFDGPDPWRHCSLGDMSCGVLDGDGDGDILKDIGGGVKKMSEMGLRKEAIIIGKANIDCLLDGWPGFAYR